MIRLGSNSQTRALILKNRGIDFVQNGSDFDEDSITNTDPLQFVQIATKAKFEELYKRFGCQPYPLLVADTVVTTQGKLLRKPKDIEDAKRMLLLQSNSTTSIITCMIYKTKQLELFDISTTTYRFLPFEKDHLEMYLRSGKCLGKAGAIMVEDFCKPYIIDVDGFESTAMGLCIEKLSNYLC